MESTGVSGGTTSAAAWSFPVVALAGVALTVGVAGQAGVPAAETVVWCLAGCAYVLAGAIIRHQRPTNPVSVLILTAGGLWFTQALVVSTTPWLSRVGFVLVDTHLVVMFHAALALPSGRLRGRRERTLVACLYAATVLAAIPAPLIIDDCWGELATTSCDVDGELNEMSLPAAVASLTALAVTVGAIITAAIALVGRLRSSDPVTRRAVAPVIVALLAQAPFLAAANAGLIVDEPVVTAIYVAVATALPVSVLWGLARASLRRRAVADLIITLNAGVDGAGLRDALRRCLGDPTLQIGYPIADGLVDDVGRPLPDGAGERASTPVQRDGRLIAVLRHAPALLEDPPMLNAVGAASSLALDNARLAAEVRSQLRELRASRERLVTAGDKERRRLERNLHDGAQQQLLTVALNLAQVRRQARTASDEQIGDALRRLASDLDAAMEELRQLARGVHPQVLTDRGLVPALQAIAERTPIPVVIDACLPRLAPGIEANAYFVTLEAITNATRHAAATEITVTATITNDQLHVSVHDDGTGRAAITADGGLQGIADRVAAADGCFTLRSEPTAGTTISIVMPVTHEE